MKKKTEKQLIFYFISGLLMFSVFGFVIVAALPTVLLFSTSGFLDLEKHSLLIQILLLIIALFAILFVVFVQTIWLWVLLGFMNAQEKKISLIKSMKQLKEHWDGLVKQQIEKYDIGEMD